MRFTFSSYSVETCEFGNICPLFEPHLRTDASPNNSNDRFSSYSAAGFFFHPLCEHMFTSQLKLFVENVDTQAIPAMSNTTRTVPLQRRRNNEKIQFRQNSVLIFKVTEAENRQ